MSRQNWLLSETPKIFVQIECNKNKKEQVKVLKIILHLTKNRQIVTGTKVQFAFLMDNLSLTKTE